MDDPEPVAILIGAQPAEQVLALVDAGLFIEQAEGQGAKDRAELLAEAISIVLRSGCLGPAEGAHYIVRAECHGSAATRLGPGTQPPRVSIEIARVHSAWDDQQEVEHALGNQPGGRGRRRAGVV